MPLLLKYQRETGTIIGVWESTSLALLEAQRVADDPVHGYLLCLLAVAANVLEQDYVVQDGVVVLRASRREGC